jgi:phage/plasmid-associated DNA primase
MFQKIFHIITSKRYGDDSQKIDYVMLLIDQIMNEYTFKTFKDTEEIYCYDSDKGVYVQGGKWRIEEQCEILYPQIPTYKVQEVVNHIKRRTGVERSMFDSNLDILNLQNGLLNIETGDFREHSPEHLSLVQLPMSFNPKAKCPKILKYTQPFSFRNYAKLIFSANKIPESDDKSYAYYR